MMAPRLLAAAALMMASILWTTTTMTVTCASPSLNLQRPCDPSRPDGALNVQGMPASSPHVMWRSVKSALKVCFLRSDEDGSLFLRVS